MFIIVLCEGSPVVKGDINFSLLYPGWLRVCESRVFSVVFRFSLAALCGWTTWNSLLRLECD